MGTEVHCSLVSLRNGGVDEEGGEYGPGADGGGEEPAVGGVQERDRSQTSFLEDNQQPWTERRKQRRRRQTKDDQGIQEDGPTRF